LGADILSDFDLEMDLAHDRVRLTCAMAAPAWIRGRLPPESALAQLRRPVRSGDNKN
jgi:hypothetical protein